MFGPTWTFPLETKGRSLTVTMGAPREGDAAALALLIQNNYIATQGISLAGAQTVEDELAFLERLRTDASTYAWLVRVEKDEKDYPLGFTSLHSTSGNRFTSGINMSDPAFWRHGITSLTHRLRTWWAFQEKGAYAIDSDYAAFNLASGAALRSVGYVETGRRYRQHLTAGRWHDNIALSAYNPDTLSVLWPDGDVPTEVMEGVEKTRAAIAWADTIIKPRR